MLINDNSPAGLEMISSRMPGRIEDALDFPIVREVCLTAGESNVRKYVEYELMKLATLVSVGGNLNNSQVVFIAAELLKFFPNETLADFKLCFQRGAIGQYGEIFRLDGIVIRGWMGKYLEEKYMVIENSLMSEKETLHQPAQTISEECQQQKIKERLRAWKDAVESVNVKPVSPLTDDEIRKEGKQSPKKATPYTPTITLEEFSALQKLRRAASEFYKGKRSFALKTFEVEGLEFMAESKEDAMEIYKLATE